jgi:hypothetical protein
LITITGLICIPIGLIVLFQSWPVMLAVLTIFSTMTAAAVVMLGSFGLSPGYYMVLLVLLRVVIEALRGGLPIPRELMSPIGSLLLFVTAAVFSLWAAVAFFQGEVIVLGGGDNFELSLAAPFQFRRENVTQLSYLVLSATLTAVLGLRLSRFMPIELAKTIDRAMVSCIIFGHVLCMWQWLSYTFSFVKWPHDFFFSNTSYAPREDQVLLDSVRLSGPFSEPSSLAVAYAGFLFYSYHRFRNDGSVASMLLVLSTILIMLLSKSSTGFLVLGLFVAFVLAQSVASTAAGRFNWRITPAGLTAIGLAFGALLAAGVYVAEHKDFVSTLLDQLIFKKQQGSSYRERTGTNLMALQILVETGGLGIGIGSHKPSSFLLTLLSNTGIAGTLVFALFLWQIMRLPSGAPGGRRIGDPLRWWIIGTMIPLVISGPNLSNAPLWTGFGLQLALFGSLAINARRPAAPIAGAAYWAEPYPLPWRAGTNSEP